MLVVAVLVAGDSVLAGFPVAALGAVVAYAALRLIDLPAFGRIARFRRDELLTAHYRRRGDEQLPTDREPGD